MTSPAPTGERCFAIAKSKGHKYYYVHEGGPDGPVAYSAVVHNWNLKAPTLQLHRGSTTDDATAVAGFARVHSTGCRSEIALGPVTEKDSAAVQYDGMGARTTFGFKEYTFETDELNDQRQRRPYTWKRTKNVPARFECRDVQTGEVLAEWRSNGFFKWTKLGTVALFANPSPRAVEYLLLVFLTWSEMENRESATLAAIT